MDLKHLTKKEKVLIFGGAGVVIFFLVKSLKGQSTNSATTTAAQTNTTDQISSVLGQFMQAQSQQNQAILGAIGQIGSGTNQTVSQTATATQQLIGQTASATQQEIGQSAAQTNQQIASLYAQHQTQTQQTAASVAAPKLNTYWQGIANTGHTTAEVTSGESVQQVLNHEASLYGVSANDFKVVKQGGKSYVELPFAKALPHALAVSNS